MAFQYIESELGKGNIRDKALAYVIAGIRKLRGGDIPFTREQRIPPSVGERVFGPLLEAQRTGQPLSESNQSALIIRAML